MPAPSSTASRRRGAERRRIELVDLLRLRRGEARLLERVDAAEDVAHGAGVGGAEELAARRLRDLAERSLVDLAPNRRVDRFDLAREWILTLDRQRYRPFTADSDRVDLDAELRREQIGRASC